MSYFPENYPRVEVSADDMPRTLEDWLKLHMQHGHIDFSLRAEKDQHGQVHFYIHTMNLDSITYDFSVHGNQLMFYTTPPTCGRIGDFSAACEMARQQAEK